MRNRSSKLDTRYLAIACIVLFGVVAGSLYLIPEWRESPAAIAILIVTAAVGVVSFASSFRSAFMPDRKEEQPAKLDYDSPQHHRNQENIAANVRAAYIDGVLREALPERARIALALDSTPDRVRGHKVLHEGREVRRPLPPDADIAAIFKDSRDALLILGAPGSGKTITLIELCEPLLEQAEADPRQPVPVILNLSTWAQRKEPLEEWIADEMWRQYGLNRKITPVWLEADHLTLLLDGLDEVAKEARGDCVRAINAFRESHGAGLAVCSRSADYAELTEQLALSRAVEIKPLTEEQVDAYLSDERLELTGVRQAIARDDALRELSTTPLMLNVMAVAYGGRPFEELLPLLDSETERRTHLYDQYIERMFRRKPLAGVTYSAAQALRWLRFISARLTEREETQFFIEDLQPDWLPVKGRYGRAILDFTIEPVDQLPMVFDPRIFGHTIKENMPRLALAGVIGGLLGGFIGNGLEAVLAGVLVGVPSAFLLGWVGSMYSAAISQIRHYFVHIIWEPTLDTKRHGKFGEGIRLSAFNAIRASVLFGVALSILQGLLGYVITNLFGGMPFRFVQIFMLMGLMQGFILGSLAFGGMAVFLHYYLRLLLHLYRLLPLRLIPFLEAMRERILLQRAGAHYRFIHRTFQEHVAALTDERIEAVTSYE